MPQPTPYTTMPQAATPNILMTQSTLPRPVVQQSTIPQPNISQRTLPHPTMLQPRVSCTRGHAGMRADNEPQPSYYNQENVAPITTSYQYPSMTTTGADRKRKSSPNTPVPSSKRVSTGTASPSLAREHQLAQQSIQKPMLSTYDLEFYYDRSKLRDPRATPGRRARPRYSSDCPEELKAQIGATRAIPKPIPPPGRLNRSQNNQLCKDESRMNPLDSFHHLYQCYDKGPQGSPTYDEAGFQLDYSKVVQWMKPQAYNKKKMLRDQGRSIDKSRKDREQMFRLFFQVAPTEASMGIDVEHYVKDRVSKDLNIPWHQIKPDQVKVWREKGFQPVVYEDWWKVPTAEEQKRFMKMMGGASLRKHL